MYGKSHPYNRDNHEINLMRRTGIPVDRVKVYLSNAEIHRSIKLALRNFDPKTHQGSKIRMKNEKSDGSCLAHGICTLLAHRI
jgi:hypothetical protein